MIHLSAELLSEKPFVLEFPQQIESVTVHFIFPHGCDVVTRTDLN